MYMYISNLKRHDLRLPEEYSTKVFTVIIKELLSLLNSYSSIRSMYRLLQT